jgi:metal-responsive CopG/Arc/MetJ family transcriptional regulator
MREDNQRRKEHITVWIEKENLDYLDKLIEEEVFENRSQAIRQAIRNFKEMNKRLGL